MSQLYRNFHIRWSNLKTQGFILYNECSLSKKFTPGRKMKFFAITLLKAKLNFQIGFQNTRWRLFQPGGGDL